MLRRWHIRGEMSVGKLVLKLLVTVLLAVIGWTDYKTMEIPDILNAALGICALISVFVSSGPSCAERLAGAVCVSVPMFLVCFVIRGAFGEGDMLLLSAMGFYLGWKSLLAGTFIGFFLGGMEAVYLLGTGKAAKGEHMAFGPALCTGLVITVFFGETLLNWYLGFFH